MPAPITHMFVVQRAKDRLLTDGDPEIVKFATDVLDRHPHYLRLGCSRP